MSKQNKCTLCHRPTMLFVWSSSRAFTPYRSKLSNLLTHLTQATTKEINQAIEMGVPVCFDCLNKFKYGGRIVGYDKTL